ncbi:MAG: alpha-hydroxy acid oxidase [Bacteroidota bacterium]
MKWDYNSSYPSIDDLRKKAIKRIPAFAFEYMDGGCNDDINLRDNRDDFRHITLKPVYIKEFAGADLKTELFGQTWHAPFGIAPIGLQGLIWPGAPEILARASLKHNIPFILSTVSTADIETISALTEGKAWYQLYHPAENSLRDDIIRRVEAAGMKTLVLLSDVPSFGYRPRDIRNGLAMPPRMTLKNILQIMTKPSWAINTLKQGIPGFATLKPYMAAGMSMKQLGQFMNKTFSGRLNEERIKTIRDKWKGKLVIKGIASEEDTETAVRLGVDGIIVSNHGGRQLDAGESAIRALSLLAPKYKSKIKLMMDSGIYSGPDIAKAIACGADFVFMGRAFMYGAAALGNRGGDHTIAILKTQLKQVMEQVGVENLDDLSKHLITNFPAPV